MEVWLGMSMALGRRILHVLLGFAIFVIGLLLVHTKLSCHTQTKR